MFEVFTKKHKKSSCLTVVSLIVGLAGPVFTQSLSKAVSETSSPVSEQQEAKRELGLPVLLFAQFELRQPNRLQSQNQAQLNALLNSLSFYIRPFAEPRLERLFKSFKSIEIVSKEQQLGIKVDTFNEFVWTPLNGDWQKFENTPRGDFQLRRWVQNGILHSEANQNGPIKQNRYYLSADGQTLRLEVTVTSKYLPQPLKLTYVYKKVD
jgi:hypothetical protein